MTPHPRSHAVGLYSCSILVAGGVCLASADARADVEDAIWGGPASFLYRISHMPDFDQARPGLAGDGKSHCVPTSIMNLFAYAANHGFEELAPGDQAWYLPDYFSEVTDQIEALGMLMSTDSRSGTNVSGAVSGATFWLQSRGGGRLVFEHATRNSTWRPKINNLAEAAIQGDIVAFCYGRWDLVSWDSSTVVVGDREGGHCVTLTQAARDGDAMLLRARDPASGGWLWDQSPWSNREMDAQRITVWGDSGFAPKLATMLDFDPADGLVRLIDTMYTLRPKASYSWSSSDRFTVHVPWTMDPAFPSIAELVVALPSGFAIVDMMEQIGTREAALLAGNGSGDGILARVSLTDGALTAIAEVPPDSSVVTGRLGGVYVLSMGERLECYDFDPELEDPLVASISLPTFARDLVYDDATDTIYVWAPEAATVIAISHDFTSMTSHETSVPEGADGRIDITPDGLLIARSSGLTSRLFAISLDPLDVRTFSGTSFTDISDYAIDSDGHLFICVDGEVHEYARETAGPTSWARVHDSPSGLDGTACDGRLAVRSSRSNYDPAIMSGPAWDDIDADDVVSGPSIPDCPGDVDGDFDVNVADLLAVLSAWGACDGCPADFDADGAVGVSELLLVLAGWGPCD